MIRQDNPFHHQISALPPQQPLNTVSVPPRPPAAPPTSPAAPQEPGLPLASQNAAAARATSDFDPGAGLFSRLNAASAQDPESIGASILRIVNALRASQQQPSPSVLDEIANKLSALKDRLMEGLTENTETQEASSTEAEATETQEASSADAEATETQEASSADAAADETEAPVSGGAAAAREPSMTFRPEQNGQSSEFDALADYQLQVRKRIQRTLDQLANTRVFQNSETLREIREKLADL